MKLKLFLITAFLIVGLAMQIKAQACADYPCVIKKVKKALDGKQYRFAFEQLESAGGYVNKNADEIAELRKQLFNAVEKEKDEASRQRGIAENLLKDLRSISDQAVKLLLNEIDRNILRLEYDSTYEKCKIALELNSERYGRQAKERVLEIAFWYVETNTADSAVKMLKLAKIDAPPDRANLLAAIKKNSSPKFDSILQERYYPKMIKVEGGDFIMGDTDQVRRQVKLSAFQVAETETTVWQYFLYLKSKRLKPKDTPSWQYEGNNPMVDVSWYDAIEYNNWLSARKSIKPAYYVIDSTLQDTNNLSKYDELKWTISINSGSTGYRLPTEAEWEFAARGGVRSKGYDYSGSNDIERVAWYSENSGSRTRPVATRQSNELGINDMTGNVWEWCFDWYGDYNSSADSSAVSAAVKGDRTTVSNPSGSIKGAYRVYRGGSWGLDAGGCRVSYRNYDTPTYRGHALGFRVASSL